MCNGIIKQLCDKLVIYKNCDGVVNLECPRLR